MRRCLSEVQIINTVEGQAEQVSLVGSEGLEERRNLSPMTKNWKDINSLWAE